MKKKSLFPCSKSIFTKIEHGFRLPIIFRWQQGTNVKYYLCAKEIYGWANIYHRFLPRLRGRNKNEQCVEATKFSLLVPCWTMTILFIHKNAITVLILTLHFKVYLLFYPWVYICINAAVAVVGGGGESRQRDEQSRARPVRERGRETDGGGLPVALLWPGVCL